MQYNFFFFFKSKLMSVVTTFWYNNNRAFSYEGPQHQSQGQNSDNNWSLIDHASSTITQDSFFTVDLQISNIWVCKIYITLARAQ